MRGGDQSEQQIKNRILQYLACRRDCLALPHLSIGVYDPVSGVYRRNNSKYFIKGTADIVIQYLVDGIPIFVHLEIKSAKGKQSSDQKAFEELVKHSGGFYFIAKSINDAIGVLYSVKEAIRARLGAGSTVGDATPRKR